MWDRSLNVCLDQKGQAFAFIRALKTRNRSDQWQDYCPLELLVAASSLCVLVAFLGRMDEEKGCSMSDDSSYNPIIKTITPMTHLHLITS